MADKYIPHAPGYNPLEDQIPPPRDSPRGCLIGGCVVLLMLLAAGIAIPAFLNNRKAQAEGATQTAIALTPSATATIDSWGSTGTALFWLTYTPTPTLDVTLTPTSTGTITPDVLGSATSLFATMWTTYETTQEPTATKPGSLYYAPATASSNNPAPSNGGNTVVITRVYITQVAPGPTSRPPIIKIVTATPKPPTRTPVPRPTAERTDEPTSTLTATSTLTQTATASETPTDFPTVTPSPSETATETSTPSETPTDFPTVTPLPTDTPTDLPTLTDVPTDPLPDLPTAEGG